MIQQTQIHVEQLPTVPLHSNEVVFSSDEVEVERMSFSKLSELACSQVTIDPVDISEQKTKAPVQVTSKEEAEHSDLLNPTLIDSKTWQ